jgi:hypothetical protein
MQRELILIFKNRLLMVERILLGFVYRVIGGSFGECMCICNFYRKSMYVP